MSITDWIRRIGFLIIVSVCCGIFFHNTDIAVARDNVYLACFIDDTTFTFKTQVVYSAQELERARLEILTNGDTQGKTSYVVGTDGIYGDISNNTINTGNDSILALIESKSTDVLPLQTASAPASFLHIPYEYFGIGETAYITRFKIEKGFPTLDVFEFKDSDKDDYVSSSKYVKVTKDYQGSNTISAMDVKWNKLGGDDAGKNEYVLPLTFPASIDRDSSNADINRAYEVQSILGTDFSNAMLYINDGKAYEDLNTMLETAYYLVTSQTGGKTTITNAQGNTYYVKHTGVSKTDSYSYKIKIWAAKAGEKSAVSYTFKVKKGYLGCNYGEETESGSSNTVAAASLKKKLKNHDTTWISWEHLYLEACILYVQGVTYSNQADLYTTDELENGVVKLFRNLLNGLTSIMQFYGLEELVFNRGIRGSSAFVYGAYYENWSPYISTFYLIFTALALSIVTLSYIHILTKKQISIVSPTLRVSLIADMSRLILCLVGLAGSWWVIKLLLIGNNEFVNIWSVYTDGKSLESVGGSYSVLATIVFQFAYFIINVYINFMYIMRSLFIAVLISLAPLFIVFGSFGLKGASVFKSWAGALIGYIFIQSIHAFVYGFVLMSGAGLRGIESVVVCASIIPLTQFVKDLFGMDIGHMEKSAGVGAATMAAAGAAAVHTGGQVLAKGTELAGAGAGAVGGYMYGRVTSGTRLAQDLTRIHAQRVSSGGGNTATNINDRVKQYSTNARYEQQRAAAIDRSNRTIKEKTMLGAKIGGNIGKAAGAHYKVEAGLSQTAIGLGYTAATREKTNITGQGIGDISGGMIDNMQGYRDAEIEGLSEVGRFNNPYVNGFIAKGKTDRENNPIMPPKVNIPQ